MSVQVAVCNAEQLFCDASSRNDPIITNSGEILIGDLIIPEYQRPYCWQEAQLKSLLSDLNSHSERLAEGIPPTGLPYYLGSVILHRNGSELNVIDGQQRITTLALLALLLGENGKYPDIVKSLEFEHPISQNQIRFNLEWLHSFFSRNREQWRKAVDLSRIQLTLVITKSEDDAYRFFETQNTGGVRLGGPDIIKAHHLRAIEKVHQPSFALQWEALGPLDETVKSLLKGRFWQDILFRELPSHKQTKAMRDTIVLELAHNTLIGGDIAFGRVQRRTGFSGSSTQQTNQQGYEVRQPLNAGVNTVRYLGYFQGLYQRYWHNPVQPHIEGYNRLINWLKELEGCGYLEGLYKACLLMYISQFGEYRLETAAKKIFRVVYSRRVSNQKAVREVTIPAFVRENPVLDWVALSYTPEQCFSYFDRFELSVDSSNLNKNSVKKRYMDKVNQQFSLNLAPEQYVEEFASALSGQISEAKL